MICKINWNGLFHTFHTFPKIPKKSQKFQSKDKIPKSDSTVQHPRTLPDTKELREFEQLCSLIDWQVMAICQISPGLPFEGLEFSFNFWFLSHNFGLRYARKSMKGSSSKDSDDSLVSKKTWVKKMTHCNWHPGPGNTFFTWTYLYVVSTEGVNAQIEKP